jgi:transcriptional regulator with XRE-family HTH domain
MLNTRIRDLRKQHGYSQEQLARKLHLTQGAVSQWENGLTVPAADQLAALADIFGISVDEIMGRKAETQEPETRDEASAIRERLRRDPSYRLLFDAADAATPEHLRAAAVMLKALEDKNGDAD